MTHSTTQHDLTWKLDTLAEEVPGVMSALVVSTDGLVIQKSTKLGRDAAETLASATCSLHSVAAALARHHKSGAIHQVVIECQDQSILIAAAGQNARLAVFCERAANLSTVAYEMSRLTNSIGDYLGTEARWNPLTADAQPAPGHD